MRAHRTTKVLWFVAIARMMLVLRMLRMVLLLVALHEMDECFERVAPLSISTNFIHHRFVVEFVTATDAGEISPGREREIDGYMCN